MVAVKRATRDRLLGAGPLRQRLAEDRFVRLTGIRRDPLLELGQIKRPAAMCAGYMVFVRFIATIITIAVYVIAIIFGRMIVVGLS